MMDFQHQHTAHCESGVMSALLKRQGCDLNEAMVFGLAAGLAFIYMPLIKLAGMPLVSYRIAPRGIIRKACKTLGVELDLQRFSSPEKGQAALDAAIGRNKLVGLQTSVFWLPYFPPEMRFHFNAHNLLVYGEEGGDYLISDPVFEHPQRCSKEDMQRARFAKGALAPRGLMYSIKGLSENRLAEKLPDLIRKSIKKNAKQMLAPVFFVGVKGMRTLAKKIEELPQNGKGKKYQKLYLGHIVRMQEEIGTGGAGFRYIYAYFLEQAAEICSNPELLAASQEMTAIGDNWRRFASLCVQECRTPTGQGCSEIAAFLRNLADQEEALWRKLLKS